jgi:hypothetical protein
VLWLNQSCRKLKINALMEASILAQLRTLSSDERVNFYRKNNIPPKERIAYEVALLRDSRNISGAD